MSPRRRRRRREPEGGRLSALMDAIAADYAAENERLKDVSVVGVLADRLGLSEAETQVLVDAILDALHDDDEEERLTYALLTGANLALKIERANELERWTDQPGG